jgi:hypothetical protein
MDLKDPILNLPWSTTPLHMGVYIQTGAKVLGILIVAFVVIRLAHVFVGGIARALLNRKRLLAAFQESGIEIPQAQRMVLTQATVHDAGPASATQPGTSEKKQN